MNLVTMSIHCLTETQRQHDEFLEFFPSSRDVSSRPWEYDRPDPIDLAAWRRLDELEHLTEDQLSSTSV